MPEIAKFVHQGVSMITPTILKGVHKKLPFLKLRFAEIDDPGFPHLSEQLEFLADVVEDFAEGFAEDLPYLTAAAAAFALIYANRQMDMIPETLPQLSHADGSMVVRTILLEHEKILVTYAAERKLSWKKVTLKP